MCVFLCMPRAFVCQDVCVCVCVSSGVREIIASEPGGERRQAITHGGRVGRSGGLGEETWWEKLTPTHAHFHFSHFTLSRLHFAPSSPLFQTCLSASSSVFLHSLSRLHIFHIAYLSSLLLFPPSFHSLRRAAVVFRDGGAGGK